MMFKVPKFDAKAWRDTIIRFHESLSETCVAYAPLLKGKANILGLYFFALGVAFITSHYYMLHTASQLYVQWTPGFRTAFPTYNILFIRYIITVFSLIAAILFQVFLDRHSHLQKYFNSFSENVTTFVLPAALYLMFATSSTLCRICFVLTVLIFLPQALISLLPKIATLLSHERAPSLRRPIVNLGTSRLMKNLWLLALLVSCALGLKAWYPVHMPDDFMHLPETMSSATMTKLNPDASYSVNRFQLSDCIQAADRARAENIATAKPVPRCAIDHMSLAEADALRRPLSFMNTWQEETGRLFYHHAYIYVPATHFLKYGFAAPIPYLYGLGNTLFYALMMRLTAPTLTDYFNAFPLAQGIGILAIVLMVFYTTRNILATFAAAALSLLFLFRIGFEAVQLAPGFNPLRYLGLAAQMVTIFSLFRSVSVARLLAIPLTLAFSLFWNMEFAMFGVVAQALAFFVPSLKIPTKLRVASIGILILIVVGAYVGMETVAQGYLHTIQAGLFGVAQPSASLRALAVTGLIWLFLIYGVTRVKGDEQMARIVALPIPALVMIKYLFTVSPVHFDFCMILVAPILLIYFPWPIGGVDTPVAARRARYVNIMISVMVGLCLLSSVEYFWRAHQRTALTMEPFAKNTWSALNEKFVTTTPADPITNRMAAIRAQIKGNDRVLFLSPFDYLMSFYANPKYFCGHFEITSNLINYASVQSVVDCVRHSSNAVVVYDEAVEAASPDMWLNTAAEEKAYALKKMRLAALTSIMDTLKPELVLVGKTGSLSFYRHVQPSRQ